MSVNSFIVDPVSHYIPWRCINQENLSHGRWRCLTLRDVERSVFDVLFQATCLFKAIQGNPFAEPSEPWCLAELLTSVSVSYMPHPQLK